MSLTEFVEAMRSEVPRDRARARFAELPKQVWQEVIAADAETQRLACESRKMPRWARYRLIERGDSEVRLRIARQAEADGLALARMRRDPDSRVRLAVARHPRAGLYVWEQLAKDKHPQVAAEAQRQIAIGSDTSSIALRALFRGCPIIRLINLFT
ncbi:MAG: hypothetical protein RBS39_02350 [Phycisphaerales bacterium]|nr:hypothetical protein [Phycisphaerales bacterium]